MCRPTITKKPHKDKLALLITSNSFQCVGKDEKGPMPPAKKSTIMSLFFFIGILILSEQILRHIVKTFMADLHPTLGIERNQHILARHIGVDALACLTISILGFLNRQILNEVSTFDRSKIEKSFSNRIHGYQPEAHRVLLLFIAYQVKNTYDSYVWDDGAIFIAHHLFAGMTAWYGMYPGVASMYGLFFMGISEISTCVLVLLANFDPQFGIDGLDQVFPLTKVVLGVLFVILFIICRVILWPIYSYHFLLDSKMVLKRDSALETNEKKKALKMMVVSNLFLTVLQIVWLGEVIMTAKVEIMAVLEQNNLI